MRKQCKEYCGVSCIDGNCPIACNLITRCKDCHKYKGCDDCCIPDIKGISENVCRKENNYD